MEACSAKAIESRDGRFHGDTRLVGLAAAPDANSTATVVNASWFALREK
jgi:hypothetical protein